MDLLIADAPSLDTLFTDLALPYRDPEAALIPIELSYRDYILATDRIEDPDLFGA